MYRALQFSELRLHIKKIIIDFEVVFCIQIHALTGDTMNSKLILILNSYSLHHAQIFPYFICKLPTTVLPLITLFGVKATLEKSYKQIFHLQEKLFLCPIVHPTSPRSKYL